MHHVVKDEEETSKPLFSAALLGAFLSKLSHPERRAAWSLLHVATTVRLLKSTFHTF